MNKLYEYLEDFNRGMLELFERGEYEQLLSVLEIETHEGELDSVLFMYGGPTLYLEAGTLFCSKGDKRAQMEAPELWDKYAQLVTELGI